MRWWRWAALILLVFAAIAFSCGKGADGSGDETTPDGGTGQVGHGNDAGTGDGGTATDAGTDGGVVADGGTTDGGTTDGGTTDGGTTDGGTTDGGTTDGGTTDGGVAWTPPPPINFPTAADWTFYGPQNGGPHDVLQVTSDGDGNIWVAGGEDGLFLLRSGSTQFERFTIADGLRPYGYLKDGSDPVGPKYLNVISVAGGDGSSVYVGYMGRPGCEDNWDPGTKPAPLYGDPSIYKSGDADHVTVTASGLNVVHYDIFSGPNIVGAEMQGRERLCTIWRVLYDRSGGNLWFGGNHGFAWGDPKFAGNPTCDGQLKCSGLIEHVHPAFNGYDKNGNLSFITDEYRGVAVDPTSGDVWFGGANRTTKFHYASAGRSFFTAELWTEAFGQVWPPPACGAPPCYAANRIDVWPDAAGEVVQTGPNTWAPHDVAYAEWSPFSDTVFGIAALPTGEVYVGSGAFGLRRLDASGNLISDETSRLYSKSVGAVARDPIDGTVWVGNRWAGGLHRLHGDGSTDHFALDPFGILANMGIEDVQFAVSGGSRKVLVAFRAGLGNAGFVAVYSGQ
jgi:hypothetical protein